MTIGKNLQWSSFVENIWNESHRRSNNIHQVTLVEIKTTGQEKWIAQKEIKMADTSLEQCLSTVLIVPGNDSSISQPICLGCGF